MSRLRNRYSFTCVRAAAIACGVLLGAGAARAHVRITNVAVAPRDAKTATIRFDISWHGVSWERKCAFRNEISHTAAWVFFKARPAVREHTLTSLRVAPYQSTVMRLQRVRRFPATSPGERNWRPLTRGRPRPEYAGGRA